MNGFLLPLAQADPPLALALALAISLAPSNILLLRTKVDGFAMWIGPADGSIHPGIGAGFECSLDVGSGLWLWPLALASGSDLWLWLWLWLHNAGYALVA